MKRLLWATLAATLAPYALTQAQTPTQAPPQTLPATQTPAQTPATQIPADQLGWQLGIHAYTFRLFSISDAIDKTAAMGLKYMSLSGSVNMDGTHSKGTMSLTDDELAAIHKKLDAAGIKLVNMGVVQLPADEAKSRKVFEFAKKLGVDTLVSEPEPDALDTVEKLCKEYNIKVAIHDHPKPSRYWNPDTVLAAVKGRTPLMGACADTGHWMRSGLDPLECVKKLQGRIICFHFKDLNRMGIGAHDVPWGTGAGNIKGILTEMKRQNFHGAFLVEYEYHWDNSAPEIAEGVKYFNSVCADLVAQPVTAANVPAP